MECADRLTLVSIVDLVWSAERREHFFRDGVVQDEGAEGDGLGQENQGRRVGVRRLGIGRHQACSCPC